MVVAVDEERLEAAVEDLARRVDREPVNGSLSYDGTTVRLEQSRVGITVQQQAVAAALIERFPSAGDPVALPAQLIQPAVDDADAERYAETGPKNWNVFYDTLVSHPDTAPIPAPPYYNAMATALNRRTTQAISSGNAKTALDGLQSDLEAAAKNS